MALIVEGVASLFIIMLVGAYGRKKNLITDEVNKGLTNILLNISLPLMVVSSFIITYNETIKVNVMKTFLYSFITFILIIIISFILLKPIKSDKKSILHFANIFMNTAYIGFPILDSVYGEEGVIYGSVFNIFFTIFIWTYGVILFKGEFNKKDLKKEIKKAVMNPSVIAVFIGIGIMIFDITLPNALLKSMKSIGNITAPLSMMLIGATLAKIKFKQYLGDWTVYYGTAIRLLIMPAILYLISLIMGDKSIVMNTMIIMGAMPAAAMTSIFAESFNKEKEFAAVMVFSTTLFSIVTLPLILSFLV